MPGRARAVHARAPGGADRTVLPRPRHLARGRRPALTESHRSYLICGTPRSGTQLLSGLLASTRQAGKPRGYFAPTMEPEWAASRYADYLDECLRRHASKNGIFGAKVLWGDLSRFLDRLRTISAEAAEADGELLERFFPGVRFVWIRRADVVAQAVSWWKAHQTREWYSGAERAVDVEPVFDYAEIHRLVGELEAANDGWGRWLAANGITPHEVLYEDLDRDKEGVARRALAFIGVEPAPATMIVARTARQADGVNTDWIRRYRAAAPAQR